MNKNLNKQIEKERKKYKYKLWKVYKIKIEYPFGRNSSPKVYLIRRK